MSIKSDVECLHGKTLYVELSFPLSTSRIAHPQVGEGVIFIYNLCFNRLILTLRFT